MPTNTNPQSAPQATVYGLPSHAERAAAVDEVHARPHLLIKAPRNLLQLAFKTDGELAGDQAAMQELSERLGVAEPDQTAPLYQLTWDEDNLHCKHTTQPKFE